MALLHVSTLLCHPRELVVSSFSSYTTMSKAVFEISATIVRTCIKPV